MNEILVVEDDAGQREALAEILSWWGYEVRCAANGREALDLIRGSQRPPSLILLDLMMPVMNGWEFLDRRRKDRNLAEVPVVVLSALGEAAEPSAAAFLTKPFEAQQLLQVVERFAPRAE